MSTKFNFIKIGQEQRALYKINKLFFITSRSIFLIIRNVSDRSCRENRNTHFVFSDFFPENRVVYVMWKNIVERGRPQMAIWRMRIA